MLIVPAGSFTSAAGLGEGDLTGAICAISGAVSAGAVLARVIFGSGDETKLSAASRIKHNRIMLFNLSPKTRCAEKMCIAFLVGLIIVFSCCQMSGS